MHHVVTKVLSEANQIGSSIAQIFLSEPQKWTNPNLDYPGGAEQFGLDSRSAGVDIVVHAPYVINVASSNHRVRIPSRKLLQATITQAAAIGAHGVVVHGGHGSASDDPRTGYDNWRKAINGLELPIPLLIENTAGGSHAMARTLDQIEQLWTSISTAHGSDRVGFTLDTCHAWAAGLDLSTIVSDIRGITGRIDLIHANNSRDAAGSGADRHAGMPDGQIDPQLIVEVIRQADTPVICETKESGPSDIAWLTSQLTQDSSAR